MASRKQTAVLQPKPKRSYASFLRDFADSVNPRLCPESAPESVDTFVSAWLESLGSDHESRCKSDSHLHLPDDDPVPRKLARSVPDIPYTMSTDGLNVPEASDFAGASEQTTDVESTAVADFTSSSGSSESNLIEDPMYREVNLASNNIYLRSSREPCPEHIAELINHVRHDRGSPPPTFDQVWQDRTLEWLATGAGEPGVERAFQNRIFPSCEPGSNAGVEILSRADRLPMAKQVVPNARSVFKVSSPVPDMLYGYSRTGAFARAQQGQINSMGRTLVANGQNLICPFFAVEFIGDGPSGNGSLWVATNECIGDSVTCVNIVELLNHDLARIRSDDVKPINSAAFSIAMSGTEARLFITWKQDDLTYYMMNVDSFLLQRPVDYVEFRKVVLNIIDWGKHHRLKEIQDALDAFMEASRKKASQAAKARRPPSPSSGGPAAKRPQIQTA